ncbi:MAG: DUF3313 domain-containing protein [Planctomycetota bacterium]
MKPLAPRSAAFALIAASVAMMLAACTRTGPRWPPPCVQPSTPCAGPASVVVVRVPEEQAKPKPPVGSGFLDDYGKLEPSLFRKGAWSCMEPGCDLREYDELLFDPIQILASPGSDILSMPADLQEKAKAHLRKIMVETIEPYYDVVDEPGPYVLRVALAITDLQPGGGEGANGEPVDVGSASLEAKLIDGETGELLLSFLDRIEGSTRGDYHDPQWREAEGAFHEWADALLHFLDSWWKPKEGEENAEEPGAEEPGAEEPGAEEPGAEKPGEK